MMSKVAFAAAVAALIIAATTVSGVASVPIWSIQPTPNVIVENNTLDSVACASAGACSVVGQSVDQQGRGASLAEQWDGSSWTIRRTPKPAGASESFLSGVACTSAAACTAVGYFPSPATGVDITLAERWNGTAWTIQPTPNPQLILNHLSAVSCTGPTSCIAVGWYITPTHGDDLTLAERWDGTKWSIQPTPNPAGAQISVLDAIACSSTTACTAVGYIYPSPGPLGYGTLVERWNGTVWSVQPSPNPHTSFGNDYLTGVACASATACSAVGYSDDGTAGGASASLAEQWDGTTWVIKPTPQPAGSVSTRLSALSCPTAAACTAVGDSFNRAGTNSSMVEHWNGTVWINQPTPHPAGSTSSRLFGVSCPGAGTCAAVGFSTDNIGATRTLAEQLNGGVWSVQSTPNVTRIAPSVLSGVACPTSTVCAAVGNFFDAQPLAEHWDASAWVIKFPAVPRLPGGFLPSVQCTAATASAAVGFSFDGNAPLEHTLADLWDSTRCTTQPTPNPAGSADSRLAAVACTAATACTAVGSSVDGASGTVRALAERWDGTTWSIQPTPTPAGTRASELAGVACTSATACTAVGHLKNGGGSALTLAERWDGTAWTIQPTPNPAGAVTSSFTGVACAAATACTAVGSSKGGGDATVTLAEQLTGTSWVIHTTPNPRGATQSVLSAVACSSETTCTAVGRFQTGGDDALTLAERLS